MIYDFIIIGGGIIGITSAYELAKKYKGAKIALLEKENDLCLHQTGRNSGVIHAGVYYTPGSLKAKFCYEGNKAIKDFCNEHGIKYDECGKLLVASNDIELQRMNDLLERTKENGLERILLDEKQLKEKEPNIIGKGGIFFPSSGIVSYKEIAQKIATLFKELGGEIFYNCEALDLIEHENGIVVKSKLGQFEARFLVTCAGIYADRLARMLFSASEVKFKMCPFKGEYYKLPSNLNNIVKHLIYPIPDPSMPFLGVHLTRMIDGSVTVGPNAVLAFKREGYFKTSFSLSDTIDIFKHKGIRKVIRDNLKEGLKEVKNSLFKSEYLKLVQKYAPSIQKQDLSAYPAGIRAQAVSDDGKLIEDFLFLTSKRSMHVCNAPSPAATSSMPISKHIVEMLSQIVEDNKAL